MVHFVCPLDWTTRCPGAWLNIILSVSLTVCLLMEHLSKVECPPQWAPSNPMEADQKEKTQITNNKNERGDFSINPTDIERMIQEYYKQFYANEF